MGSISRSISAVALTRRAIAALVVAATAWALLAYLRDPPWLIAITSGMRPETMDASGRHYRWMGGHASLFVPSDARLVSIPLRTTFDAPADQPVTVSITIDDRPVDRIVLTDAQWRLSSFRLPPRGPRRVRRVDIRVDRTRDDNRGAAVGDVTTVRTP
jgi:hypothetical protein